MFSAIRIAVKRMTRGAMRSLLRVWMRINRHDRYGRAGFVLPTVTMVLLVVVLLSITIMLRSMDRAKMAQYRRVDEQVLQAATPALDRANAKLTELLADPTLPKETPSDEELYRALNRKDDQGKYYYTLGGEERIVIQYDVDGGGIYSLTKEVTDNVALEKRENITTAWRFPVDTNNNGKYDSYALYGIYFKRPPDTSDTPPKPRPRSPLDARSLPMDISQTVSQDCAALGSSAGFIDSSGWARIGGNLKKAFFVYTTTVPIPEGAVPADTATQQFEFFKGTPSFSALEYQQDRSRVPLTNNAVVYEDDLDISPGPFFNLNGRIFSNSNLIASPRNSAADTKLRLYQVSSPKSCFYTAENSKIIVGGNVINGVVDNDALANPVEIHLFKEAQEPNKTGKSLSTSNDSVTLKVSNIIYDNKARADLITALVKDQLGKTETSDPEEVKSTVAARQPTTPEQKLEYRTEALTRYFKDRSRRIPIIDPFKANASSATIEGSGDTLRPPDTWMLSVKPTDGSDIVGVGLEKTQLPATDPDAKATELEKEEFELGDRIVAGNNLAYKYYLNQWRSLTDKFYIEGSQVETNPSTGTTKWTNPKTNPRYRRTQVQPLPDLGTIGRNGFWEESAASKPEKPLDGIGGLRVVTGAGIYNRNLSFLPPPVPLNRNSSAAAKYDKYDNPDTTVLEEFEVVWPDTMPMSPIAGSKVYDKTTSSWVDVATPLPTGNAQNSRGDLRMRATAVYHYATDFVTTEGTTPDREQKPIACVSSYYDPTDSITAKNMDGLPWNSSPSGRSNNGIVYPAPKTERPTSASFSATTGLFTATPAELGNQANMVFPDGRFVNLPLRNALNTLSDGGKLTLADQSAIDSTLCALDILNGDITPNAYTRTVDNITSVSSDIPHGAIREVSFLDSREVKALDKDDVSTRADETFALTANSNLPGTYQLPLENRYPLEIRATVLDVQALRNTTITQGVETGPKNGTNEYMLPFSGIIYASRDDGKPDYSDRTEAEGIKLKSSTDYKIDPSRSPNGILLINGKYLARGDVKDGHGVPPTSADDVVKEKGLTLISNLPVYIYGEFNLHSQQEFSDKTLNVNNWETDFYARSTLNKNFACHKGDPRLPDKCQGGDTWRPANVIADAVTVLSRNLTATDLTAGFRFGYRNEGDFELRNNAYTISINPAGYDLNVDGDTSDSFNENDFTVLGMQFKGFDLNGNGALDASVPETTIKSIPAKLARVLNGFNPYNDFAVNGLSSNVAFDAAEDGTPSETYKDTDYSPISTTDSDGKTTTIQPENGINSSYFNNFVTPIQRRGIFPEYLMEICLKLPVSACGPGDWVVIDSSDTQKPARNLVNPSTAVAVTTLKSGTTATPPDPKYQRFPRRVAFLRTSSNTLQLDGTAPIPIGVNGSAEVKAYAPVACPTGINQCIVFSSTDATKQPRTQPNALWFQTRNAAARNWGSNYPLWYYNLATPGTSKTTFVGTEQPLLVPVLQIHASSNEPSTNTTSFPFGSKTAEEDTRWLPKSVDSQVFNLVAAAGDTPPRAGEFNGGLQNLVRFLENWYTNAKTIRNNEIVGSFMQLSRSGYATAPYQPVTAALISDGIFGNKASNDQKKYRIINSGGRTPFFTPPTRAWGFDVGLLSQTPDLFTQKFTIPPTKTSPNEYFREVSRDDPWVKELLCAKLVDATNNIGDKAVSSPYRPEGCSNGS
ncbi:hypothetical protein PCC9214_01452 [Planktothrix tepida]|uniref:Uncharacterized protein n=1 Tax=Planktothrix tepida PCC 9214 TaxID=671072 RepID=A0A1J1LGY4_9CYAN|nr:hormogonium polysaccharide biosynthesis protein HpsA [Planktothrix tepida]CAD5933574.1 hypothetical protein PCC9214_01452 [Planktothrix tepida]CUR31739.1 conserved hypothetical protein [Planktothrix tepida PCC 9214]